MRLILVLTQTGITKYNRLDALNNKKILLTVLDAVGADSRCYQGCCLMRALSLGCRQPPSPSGLTSPFFVHLDREDKQVLWYIFFKGINPTMRASPL